MDRLSPRRGEALHRDSLGNAGNRRPRRWRDRARRGLVLAAVSAILGGSAVAGEYGGVEFPQGAASFGDAVIRYLPQFSGGAPPTHPNFLDPRDAIGVPNYTGGEFGTGAVALGSGGLLEVLFADNVVTNSGDGAADLAIFEVGPIEEHVFVAVRPATEATAVLVGGRCDDAMAPLGDGFCELGKFGGGTMTIDLDAIFPGAPPGALRFDAVQLLDDIGQNNAWSSGPVGADIDAVGGTGSAPITCGDGAVEGNEGCDDGALAAGDGCDGACQVELCYACAGEPSVCAPAAGMPCEDGHACTVGDACTAEAVCVGGPPTDCSDGNVCTTDSCDAMLGCLSVPAPGPCDDGSGCSVNDTCVNGHCVGDAAIASACVRPDRPGASALVMEDGAVPERDFLVWRWSSSETRAADFGDPAAGGTGYEMCVFDYQSPALPQAVLGVGFDGGGVCGNGQPCWWKGTRGYLYEDKPPTNEALSSMRLRQTKSGRTRISLRVRGGSLVAPELPLAQSGMVKVQLRRSDSTTCWEADYLQPPIRASTGVFRDRND